LLRRTGLPSCKVKARFHHSILGRTIHGAHLYSQANGLTICRRTSCPRLPPRLQVRLQLLTPQAGIAQLGKVTSAPVQQPINRRCRLLGSQSTLTSSLAHRTKSWLTVQPGRLLRAPLAKRHCRLPSCRLQT
jgi:hypothetical protein